MRVGSNGRAFVTILGAATLVATMLVADVSVDAGTVPAGNGRLACSSNRDGDFEIWTFGSTGTEVSPSQLTTDPGTDGRPRYSPDGRQIVFESSRNGGNDLYVMNADGTNQTRLTFTQDATSGDWSPDGSQIVYQRLIEGLSFEIYKVNIDGTGVTGLASNSAEDSLPTWSPDGTQIAFSSRRTDASADVHFMTPFGTNITSLAANVNGVEDSWPTWSPDGTQVAFHSRRDDATGEEIYRALVSGGGATRLTTNVPGFDIFPAWSPDGTRIVLNSEREGATSFGEIFTISAATGDTSVVRITNNAAVDQRCSWQPLCTIYASSAGSLVGTAGDDIICGSPGVDRIFGGGGNDRILGLGGDDQIDGGTGSDSIFAGVGNDSVQGGSGVDFISGGPGNDRILGESGEKIDVGGGTNQCSIGASTTCPAPLS